MPPELKLPLFTEASSSMAAFLRQGDLPQAIRWIFRDEVTTYRRKIWLRATANSGASKAAETLYEAGRRRGLGVQLRAFCRTTSYTACHIWIPDNEMAAQYAMQPRGLKLAVPTPLLPAKEIRSRLRWRLLELLNRWRPFGDSLTHDLPNRPDLEP
jgi:hypothetical protein